MDWRLHWLEAEGDLTPWRDVILAEVEAAKLAIARLMPPCTLDILIRIRRRPGQVIPVIGMGGSAWGKYLFDLGIDPGNPNLETSLKDGALRRLVAHEAHHCMRYAAIGYGETLGEALVSEGLAGRFVERIFGTAPEPWENALDEAGLRAHLPDDALLASSDYSHATWFYCWDGRLPCWLGYTLGYRIVGDWLAAVPAPDAASWAGVPAETVLAIARERGILANPGRA
ncbi:MAG: DUF2268 domain-containing putative Zn-dependent protease [Alphaproteobacteria bacterium]